MYSVHSCVNLCHVSCYLQGFGDMSYARTGDVLYIEDRKYFLKSLSYKNIEDVSFT